MASGDHSSLQCAGLSLSRPLLLRSTSSRCAGSVIVAHGPSCSAACGIPPDQGSNPRPLHWQADSQPLRHQGSPRHISFLSQLYWDIIEMSYCISLRCKSVDWYTYIAAWSPPCYLSPASYHIITISFCGEKFKIYFLTNFQVYNTVLLTIVTMHYIRVPELSYPITGSLYSLTNILILSRTLWGSWAQQPSCVPHFFDYRK